MAFILHPYAQAMGSVCLLGWQEAVNTLTDEAVVGKHFTKNILEAHPWWLKLTKTNNYLRHIAMTTDVFITATPGEAMPSVPSSISYGDAIRVPLGYRYNFYFMGEELDELFAHVMAHVRRQAVLIPRGVDIYFTLKYNINDDATFRDKMQAIFGGVYTNQLVKSTFSSTFQSKI